MASQPLETIPEETVAPEPTPARVTADPPKTTPAKTKNPGRVASRKRLAERNRLAREAKKQANPAQPSGNTPANTANTEGDTNKEASGISLMTMLGIGGFLVSAAGVYYQREAIKARLNPAPPTPPGQPAPAPKPSRIPVKRGIKEME